MSRAGASERSEPARARREVPSTAWHAWQSTARSGRLNTADIPRAWAAAKLNVVRRFGVSSLRKGREFAAQGRTPEAKGLHFPEYACHGGGECGAGAVAIL